MEGERAKEIAGKMIIAEFKRRASKKMMGSQLLMINTLAFQEVNLEAMRLVGESKVLIEKHKKSINESRNEVEGWDIYKKHSRLVEKVINIYKYENLLYLIESAWDDGLKDIYKKVLKKIFPEGFPK